MFFTKSLRIKAIIAALVPTVLVLAVVAVIGLYVYERLTRDIVEQRDTELAMITAARLSEGLTPHRQILQNLAADNDVQSMELVRLRRALEKAQLQLFVFDSVLVYDHRGVAVSSDPFSFERRRTDFPVPSEFEKVRSTRQPHFSDVFKDSHSGQDAILLAVPVVASGAEFKGMVVGISTLSSLLSDATYSAVLEITAGGEGFAYLVDGNGRVIYHRDSAQLGRDLSDTTPVMQVRLGEADAVITKDSAGERVISGFAPVPGTSWGVITQEEWSNVVGPIQDYGKLLVVLLALGGVLSGSFIFFAIGRVLKPIKDLTQGAQRIAGGDFGHTIVARTGDEVQALAQQFNTMAGSLKESYADLEQKVAERTEDVRESEERYRALFEESRDAIFISSRGKVVAANEAALELFAFTREEAVGSDVGDRYDDPADQDRFRQAIDQTGSTRDFEVRLRKQNGEVMDCLVTATRRRSKDGGGPGEIQGLVRDVTEHKRAEQALRESEERTRLILETAQEAFIAMDAGGSVTEWNPQAVSTFGWTRSETVGKLLSETIIPPHYREAHTRGLQHFLATGEGPVLDKPLELSALHRDGHEFPVELTISAIRRGDTYIFNAFLRDITERKRAEEALRQYADELARSNADLQQFAYVASHDLQEPLRMVSSYTQLLGRRYTGKLDADADEFIGYAVDGATRMQDLINDLLAYSRVGTSGKSAESTDCNRVLEQVINDLRVAIDDSRAVVVHDPLPTVAADESDLAHLFQNLITNAIKFHGDEQPRVHVSAELEGKDWVFSVRDNGIGIEQEYADRIFRVFQRLHTRDKYSGTGIWLAICKRVVEGYGGRIWLESELGKGSVFYFTIPTMEDT